MPVHTLGIDIRDELVALTLVAKKLGGADLVNSHWFRLLTRNESGDPGDLFAQEVNDFLSKGKTKPKSIIVSLPRQSITVQSFDLPTPEANALDAMIQLEMDRHFPFPLDDMNVSYHVDAVAPNRNHVIAAAAGKENVGQVLEWLARAGLKADVVESSLANQMTLLNQDRRDDTELQAIVDIGSNRVDVSLIKGKTLITTRSLPIPDPEFSKMFFHHDLPESLTERITNQFIDFLTGSLESTLYGCKSLESDESITHIHLFGGGHAQEYLVAPLANRTDVPTKVALPDFLKKDSPLSFNPSFQMTALGLAMRPFLQNSVALNLHPEAKSRATRTSEWTSTVILTLMVPVVVAGVLWAQTYQNDQTLASLNLQLESLKPLAADLERIDREYDALAEHTKTLNTIESESPLKLPLLQELSHKLPQDTWVTRISIKENQVEIRGYSASASKLIPSLEASDYLKDTRFKGSVTTQAQGKRFTIQSTMEPQG